MPLLKINNKVNKLLIALYALMVLSLLSSLGVAIHQNWHLKLKSTKVELARQAGIGNFIVENDIIHTTKSLSNAQKSLEKVLGNGPLNASQVFEILQASREELSAYNSHKGLLLYLDRQGELLARTEQQTSERIDLSDRSYFQRIKQEPNIGRTLSPLTKARTTGEWVFHVAMPIKDKSGQLQGVLAQQIQAADIENELTKYLDSSKSVQVVTQSADHGLAFAYPLHLITQSGPAAIDTPYADFARRSDSPQDTFTWPLDPNAKESQALVGYAYSEQSGLLTTIHLPLTDVWFSFFQENIFLLIIAGMALILVTVIFMHLYRVSNQLAKALHDAFFDALTQIPNRRSFEDMFPRLLREAARTQQPLSVLFIDIDHFKCFNDDYGHDGGDIALRAVAQAVKQCTTRPLDFVCRWGGEEFVTLLPHTSEESATLMAQKVLTAVRKIKLSDECGHAMRNVSVSVGIASGVITSPHTGEYLVHKADEAMKKAKQGGRDRYVIYGHQGQESREKMAMQRFH
jgi:diguanylate cyclase (GGDEF)-like protein